VNSFGQNIFDKEHSLRYIDNLYNTGNYDLLLEELSDMQVDSNEENAYYHDLLIRSNYALKRVHVALKLIDCLGYNSSSENINYYAAIALYHDSISVFEKFMDKKVLTDQDLILSYLLLMKRFDQTESYIKQHRDEISDTTFYTDLIALRNNYKTKNKHVATALSILPGFGKFYLNQPVDGITAFAFTSLYGYLSISSFQIAGMGSVFGWVNAGLCTAFYLGNIVGTSRAATRYNSKVNIQIDEAIKKSLYNRIVN
jgi:TM2 domain-containing membrane protein YozV